MSEIEGLEVLIAEVRDKPEYKIIREALDKVPDNEEGGYEDSFITKFFEKWIDGQVVAVMSVEVADGDITHAGYWASGFYAGVAYMETKVNDPPPF